MADFRKTVFVTSVVDQKDRAFSSMPELLMVGRSNVGKSSLINALADNKSLAKVSSTPGKTRLLNYFNVDNAFYLVDAPGYGYAKQGKKSVVFFDTLMKNYFAGNSNIKGAIFLLDSRRTISEDDMTMLDYLHHFNIKYLLVYTKTDKLNQSMRHRLTMEIQNTSWRGEQYVFSSIGEPRKTAEVRAAIARLLD